MKTSIFEKTDIEFIDYVFKEVLPRHNFEVRPNQILFSKQVAVAADEKLILIANIGVGTGKTLSYLIAAFNFILKKNKPVIIVTKTIQLQNQLIADISKLNKLKIIKENIKVECAKGKENYLCIKRFKDARFQYSGNSEFEQLCNWQNVSTSIDRINAPNHSDNIWKTICVHKDQSSCIYCSYEKNCQYLKLRKKWKKANNIIVTNYGLFLNANKYLSKPGLIIMDEAHALEESARNSYTISITRENIRQIRSERPDGKGSKILNITRDNLIDIIDDHVDKYDNTYKECSRLPLLDYSSDFKRHFVNLRKATDKYGEYNESDNISENLRKLEDAGNVSWIELNSGKWIIKIAPRDLAKRLSNDLFERKPIVLCSGTLAIKNNNGNRSFEYTTRQLGISNFKKSIAESPFNYQQKCLLYIANNIPLIKAQDSNDFYKAIPGRIAELLDICRGRTLVLFTSIQRMGETYAQMKTMGLKWPILIERKGTRKKVVKEFEENNESVLFSTGLWEGIDFPGETLSCVICVKLPFPPPDPVIMAKRAMARKANRIPFKDVDISEMLLKLQQGCGRLIRSENDSGVIAILDGRALKQSYFSIIKKNIWGIKPTSDLGRIKEFFK